MRKAKRLQYQSVVLLCFLCIILLCDFLINFVDRPLSLYCKTGIPQQWEWLFQSLEKLGQGEIWYSFSVISFVAWYLHACSARTEKRWKSLRWSYVALWLFSGTFLSGIIVEVCKTFCGRARPLLLFEENIYGFSFLNGLSWIAQSFPSGHSQTIWSVVTVLIITLPMYRISFIIAGLLVSTSRVITTAHYLSDVVMGSFIGVVSSLLLYNTFYPRTQKQSIL